uniref:Plant bHLH transcription factor ACT-like domain-containing protein n=1 Tax=Chenopodium quinoa TaxID=63459 RepID=A0A803MNL8_CHEQI
FVIRSKEDYENDTATSDVDGANVDTTRPEIVLKVLDKKILLNVFCEKRQGILTTIIEELEKYGLSVVTFSMIPFENTVMDITIVAQMETDQNLKDFTETLRLALVVFVIRSKEQNDEDDTATSGDVSSIANLDNILPEIVLKVYNEKILLNVFCEKRKGVLTTILKEVEKYDLSVVNCSIIPLDNKALDITIVAQEKTGEREAGGPLTVVAWCPGVLDGGRRLRGDSQTG